MSIQSSSRSRLSEKLKQKEAMRRAKQAELIAVNEKISSMYGGKDRYRKQEQLRLQQLKEEEEERLRLELIEKKRIEDERKTKLFFEFNKYDRRVAMEGRPTYFGDFVSTNTAWIPHGHGSFTVFDKEVLDGKFVKGDFVHGTIRFSDGTAWMGDVVNHRMNGVGQFTTQDGTTHEVIARDNEIVCFKHELTNGLHIQFKEQFNDIFPVLNRKPVATIVKNVKEWVYLLKFHDEVWPEDREIDLSRYSNFSILRDKPCVYTLQGFEELQLSPRGRVDDYRLQPKHDRRLIRDTATNRLNDELNLDRLLLQSSAARDVGSFLLSGGILDDDFDGTVLTVDTRTTSTSTNSPSEADNKSLTTDGPSLLHKSIRINNNNSCKVDGINRRNNNNCNAASYQQESLSNKRIAVDHHHQPQPDSVTISSIHLPRLVPTQHNIHSNPTGGRQNNRLDNAATAFEDDDNISMYTDISESTYHSTARFNSRFAPNPNSLPSLLRRAKREERVTQSTIPGSGNRKYLLSKTSELIPKFPKRDHLDRSTNIFEARAIGVGTTKEADELAKQAELKKRQFAALIQERQAKEEDERRRQIEEQQQQFMQQAMNEKHKDEQAKKDEMDQFLKDTKAAVEDELSVLSKSTALSRVEEYDQLKSNRALRSTNLNQLPTQFADARDEDQVTTVSRSSALSRAEDLAPIAEHPYLTDSNLHRLNAPVRRPWRFRDDDELSVASQVSLMSIAEEVERVADADYVHV